MLRERDEFNLEKRIKRKGLIVTFHCTKRRCSKTFLEGAEKKDKKQLSQVVVGRMLFGHITSRV